MPTDNTHDLRARREAVVNAHIEAETVTHDVAAALATFHHPRYEVPAVGAIADGGEAVEGLLTYCWGRFLISGLKGWQPITPMTQSSSNANSAARTAARGPESLPLEIRWRCKAPASLSLRARIWSARRSISTMPRFCGS